MAHRRLPICVPCHEPMTCETNSVAVQDGEPDGLGCVSLAYGDTFRCPKCGNAVLTNFGNAFFTNRPPLERLRVGS